MKLEIGVTLDVKGGFNSKRGTWVRCVTSKRQLSVPKIGPKVLKAIEELTEDARTKLQLDEVVTGRYVYIEENK